MSWEECTCGKAWMVVGPLPKCPLHGGAETAVRKPVFSAPQSRTLMNGIPSKFTPGQAVPLPEDWMRVAPGTDAAIWRPWSRETGEL